MLYVYMGCCLLGLGWHTEAEEKAMQGPACPLQNRCELALAPSSSRVDLYKMCLPDL